jgi:hypothetical protein
MWIAGGYSTLGSGATGAIGYSYDGIQWSTLSNPLTSGFITNVIWNGTMWIVTGGIINSSGQYYTYSYNGISWTTPVAIFSNSIYNIAYNARRPYTLTFPSTSSIASVGSTIGTSFPITIYSTSRLDVVSDAYYNLGYTNFTVTMNTQSF